MRIPHALRSTLVIAVSAMFCSRTVLHAQTTFGILVGGNAATISGVDLTSNDLFNGTSTIKNRLGFQGGFYINKRFNSQWSLQPEIHYVQKGATLNFGGTGQAPGNLAFDFGYAEIPVLLRLDLGSGTVHPFITGGPSVAMRVACSASLAASNAKISLDCDEVDDNGTQNDPFKTSDIGGSVGAGLVGRLMGRTALVQLRYGPGFTSILSEESSANDDQKPKNAVIVATVGTKGMTHR